LPVVLAIISSLLLCSFSVPAQAKSEEEWKERTVYQIVSGLPQQARQPLVAGACPPQTSVRYCSPSPHPRC
jgi:hypothetical protein